MKRYSRLGMRMAVVIFLAVWGCSSQKQLDLAAEREMNVSEDLSYLKAREPLAFPEKTLGLDAAVRLGLQNNLEIRINKLLADVADDKVLAEKLKMLPELELEADLSARNNNAIKEFENLDTGDRNLSNSISEDKTSKTANLTLTWNLLDFGLSYLRSRQAAMGREIRDLETRRQAQKLAQEIIAAYWKTILAQQDLDYIAKIDAEAREYMAKVEEMVAQKRMDPIAVKMVEKKITDLAITASKLHATVSGARIELCRLMGLPPSTEFSLAEEDFLTYLKKMPKPEAVDPQKLELIALKNRPELFANDLQVKVQQDEAKAAMIDMFPGVRLYHSVYYDGNSYLQNNDWLIVGVGLASDLLATPGKYMSWKAQGKSVNVVKSRRLMLTAGIMAQVNMALHDYTIKAEQFKLYNDAYSISDTLLSMSRERQTMGAMTETDVTSRMIENMVAKLERDRNLVDLINSYYLLLVTLGVDYDNWHDYLPRERSIADLIEPPVEETERLAKAQPEAEPAPAPVKPRTPVMVEVVESAKPAYNTSYNVIRFRNKQVILYRVKAGDSIIDLLRDKGHVPESQIENEFLRLFLTLNPDLDSFYDIDIGQEIYLPLPLYVNPVVFQ